MAKLSDRSHEAHGLTVSVQGEAPPIVRAIANDLVRCLREPAFVTATHRLKAVVSLRALATPQSVTLLIDDDRVSVVGGLSDDADLKAAVDLQSGALCDLGGPGGGEDSELVRWLGRLLEPPSQAWADAATSYWSVLSRMAGAPAGLKVVNLDRGEERSFGAPEGDVYEIHGATSGLVSVLSGRIPLLDAVFEHGVLIRGSFAQISVLTGAGFEIRYGGEVGNG